MERLLSIQESYWSQFAFPDNTAIDESHQFDTPDHQGKARTATLEIYMI